METRLEDLFEKFWRECKFSSRLRSETIRGYSHAFSAFSRIMPEVEYARQLTPEMMVMFFEKLQTRVRVVGKGDEVTGVKDSTVKTYWSKLSSFFKWLEKRGHITENPFDGMVKPPEPVYDDERALLKDQIGRIVSSVALNNTEELLMRRDLAMFNVLLYTGIRKGELLGLQVTDVDFYKEQITVRAATSKSKISRDVPMNPTLIMHLKTYIEQRNARGYKTPSLWVSMNNDSGLSSHGLKHWVNRYNELSGVRFHLHQFRHTFACGLVEANVHMAKIQKLMGHKNIKMTQSYLRSIKVDDCREDINKLVFN
jgi:site-specific recombinase XerD